MTYERKIWRIAPAHWGWELRRKHGHYEFVNAGNATSRAKAREAVADEIRRDTAERDAKWVTVK